MKERPILFSTLMVRSILNRSKSQTRRVIKPQPQENDYSEGLGKFWWKGSHGWDERQLIPLCPYGQPGDILWVRETFAMSYDTEDHPELTDNPQERWNTIYVYKADGNPVYYIDGWKPSIFMPKAACRIKLEITDVRIERLQDITEDDAKAEGITDVEFYPDEGFPLSIGHMVGKDDGITMLHTTRVKAYQLLWESINGKGSWDKNPWVWVISLKLL